MVEVDDDYVKGDWVEAMFEDDQAWYPGVVEDRARPLSYLHLSVILGTSSRLSIFRISVIVTY